MQEWPQLPQLLLSFVVSTHVPPHVVPAQAPAHDPLVHIPGSGGKPPPGGHTVAQAPQLKASVCRFTQTPPQLVKPVAQPVTTQLPAWHARVVVGSLAQGVPQAPQFAASLPFTFVSQLPSALASQLA